MPDLDHPHTAATHGTPITAAGKSAGAEPAVPSRRAVIRVAAGAGAAGIAATAFSGVIGGMAAQASTRTGTRPASGGAAAATDPVVLHVRDASTGEIDVFRGTTQTRLHDRDLAGRILRASR